jgi:hypothetical protein
MLQVARLKGGMFGSVQLTKMRTTTRLKASFGSLYLHPTQYNQVVLLIFFSQQSTTLSKANQADFARIDLHSVAATITAALS